MRAKAKFSFVCTNQIQYNTLHLICHRQRFLCLKSRCSMCSPKPRGYADSPRPNILMELFHAASHTSSTVIPLICAIAYATCGMVAGSFRPLTIEPLTNFSFLTALGRGGASLRNLADA